jgi:hypothetical protein
VALPIAAAIATGGASLGVQIAAGAAAGGLGGFLAGKDPLTSALIGGATAGLGNVTGANEAIGGVLSNASDAVKNALIPELAKQAATEAGGDIVVNALTNLAKGAGAGVLQGAASGVASGASPTATQPTQRNVVDGVDQDTGEIVVSKYRPINPVGGFDPTSVSKDLIGLGGSVAATLPALTELAMDPTLTQPQAEDIVVSGNRPVPQTVVPDELAAIGPLLPALGIPQVPTPDPTLTDKGGVLGTGLNVPQLISIGSIGADLLQNLLAGGGGAGTGTPYVSQFGPGVGIGAGQDMRANPTILDYERYGFGPEAMFFQPGYGLLNSAATPTQAPPIMAVPQAQPAMVTNPRYEPLI